MASKLARFQPVQRTFGTRGGHGTWTTALRSPTIPRDVPVRRCYLTDAGDDVTSVETRGPNAARCVAHEERIVLWFRVCLLYTCSTLFAHSFFRS